MLTCREGNLGLCVSPVGRRFWTLFPAEQIRIGSPMTAVFAARFRSAHSALAACTLACCRYSCRYMNVGYMAPWTERRFSHCILLHFPVP